MKSAFNTMLDAVKRDIASRFSHLKEQQLLKVGIANTLMDPDKFENFRKEMKENFPDMELVYLPLDHEHRDAYRAGCSGYRNFPCPQK